MRGKGNLAKNAHLDKLLCDELASATPREKDSMPTVSRAKRSELPPLPISERVVVSLAQMFKLLSDASRLRVLLTLARDGEMHVSALCETIGQSQPTMSHHLMLLRTAGLVSIRRAGRYIYYRVDAQMLGENLERLLSDFGRSFAINLGQYSLTLSRAGSRRR